MKSKRSLNPLQARYFFQNFNIKPKNDIFLDLICAKSVSVETFRRHGFGEELKSGIEAVKLKKLTWEKLVGKELIGYNNAQISQVGRVRIGASICLTCSHRRQ